MFSARGFNAWCELPAEHVGVGEIGAAMAPLLAAARQIEKKPLQSTLLALAAGAVLALLRRR